MVVGSSCSASGGGASLLHSCSVGTVRAAAGWLLLA
eukprot:SAG25_NODE_10033_length_348_cov_0.622490_2_plen_35_part_01